VSEAAAGQTAGRETDVKLTKLEKADNRYVALPSRSYSPHEPRSWAVAEAFLGGIDAWGMLGLSLDIEVVRECRLQSKPRRN